MSHRLVVISGYDSQKVFSLTENFLTFGRDGQNSVVLDHIRVSRRHCGFRVIGEQAIAEDFGSTNFTFRNNHPLPSNASVEMLHNDRFKIDLLRLAYLKGDNSKGCDLLHDGGSASGS